MQPSIIDIVLSITALSRSELEMLAERLVNDFPERADGKRQSNPSHFYGSDLIKVPEGDVMLWLLKNG